MNGIGIGHSWHKFLPRVVRKKIENRHNLQKIIDNVGWLFADKLLRLGGGLLVGVWVARYLGPDQFGLFSYSLAFSAMFTTIAALGLDGIVVRNIVRDPSCRDEVLGTVFVLKVAGGVVAIGLTLGSIFLLRPHDTVAHLLVGVIAVGTVFQAFDVIDFWFQSQILSRYTIYAKNSAFLVITVVKILLILMNAPLVSFAYAGLAEIILGAVGLMLVYRINGYSMKKWRGGRGLAGKLLHDSWPLIFSGIVIMIYMRIDQVMLGDMVGNEEVGIYSAAVRLAEAWYFIPGAIVASVFPSIVEAKTISDDLFYGRLQKLYNLMTLLGYIVALPVTFLASWLIKFLYGTAYIKAGPMLALLIWAGLFVNLGIARSSFLTTMNWTRVHFMTVFLGCIVNVALNFVLIPRYGGMGAVIASCVAYWFAVHGACFVYKPLYKTGRMLTKAMAYPKVWS
jgi:O-antigen/teichoic acid export membrane protein